jgi:hypothetical protein
MILVLVGAATAGCGDHGRAGRPAESPATVGPDVGPPQSLDGRVKAVSGTWEKGPIKSTDGRIETTVRITLRYAAGTGSGSIRAERHGEVMAPLPGVGKAEVEQPFTFSLGKRGGEDVIETESTSGRHTIAFEVRGDTLWLNGKYRLSGLTGEIDLAGDWRRVSSSVEAKKP